MSFDVYKESTGWLETTGHAFWAQESVESTSDEAKKEALAPDLPPFKVYMTNEQSSGRGRGNNTWQNPERGQGFLGSFSFSLTHPPQHISGPLFGLSLYRAAKASFPEGKFSIKAPNDLYLNSKKVAGILLEGVSQGDKTHRLVLGLGVNVQGSPGSVPEASSFASELESEIEPAQWSKFLGELIHQFQMSKVKCTDTTISAKDKDELLEALNENPRLSNPYLEVTAGGDLITPSGLVEWRNL